MYALIVFLPLVGSVLAGLLSLNNHDRPAELATVIGLLSSLMLSVIAFAEVAIGAGAGDGYAVLMPRSATGALIEAVMSS